MEILNAPGVSVSGPKSCPNNKIFRDWMVEVSQYTGNLIESEDDQTKDTLYVIDNASDDQDMNNSNRKFLCGEYYYNK